MLLGIFLLKCWLSIARTRAKSLGLDSIVEFRESDAEKLNFPESIARFDAILSRWSLMFLPNLHAALVGIRQMLVTNGRLSAAVWSAPSKIPWLDLAFSTVRNQIGATAPAPSAALPRPFALTNAEDLKESFSQAGFIDIKIEMLQITFDFDSP